MAGPSVLDWSLILGLAGFGVFLAIRVNRVYKVSIFDFMAVTFYVACLASLITGAYHYFRVIYLG